MSPVEGSSSLDFLVVGRWGVGSIWGLSIMVVNKASTAAAECNIEKVFLFGDAYKYFQGNGALMREALGGKGAGLAEMTASGINVPPGFTLTTGCCRAYYENSGNISEDLNKQIVDSVKLIEASTDRVFGSQKNPLLVSVRSGAKYSMPGMMDTVLNLGLNDLTVKALAKMTNNERFAFDSYRRLIQMFGNVVLGISKDEFEHVIESLKKAVRAKSDHELTLADLQTLVIQFKEIIQKKTGQPFIQDVHEQLKATIEAVFKSWNNARAIYYRNLHKIDHNIGTAVNIQAMVFGNLNSRSATGVCFTRDPSTGDKKIYGEYLTQAQGEDVVAGTRTPKKIMLLAEEMPIAYEQLVATTAKLEKHYADMQDIEFTIENDCLFLLQTRTAKRTAAAAVKIAVDLVNELVITKDEALLRVEPGQLNQLLLPSFTLELKEKAKAAGKLIAKGLNASPGAARGQIVFHPDQAELLASRGEKVILVRVETCPDDIHGIVPAQGVVTSRGGMTSHAAVVARGMGKPCVAGCDALQIDLVRKEMKVGTKILKEGQTISIDGATGEIFEGIIETASPHMSGEFQTLLSWADERRRMDVRANADTPEDAKVACQFGAQGIGLCRTEHMFMSHERLPVMQAMIMAKTKHEREQVLAQLLPMQRHDFSEIFKVMNGLPVNIRLLDPPLHEFLPKYEDLVLEVATHKYTAKERATANSDKDFLDKELLLAKVMELKEANPMMGLRGCRLGLLYPEINAMQVRAIFEAAVAVKKQGVPVSLEIMIPLVGEVQELIVSKKNLETIALDVMEEHEQTIEFSFGTMIEIPRACVTADEIAQHAQFFSFGTNDLTQMTYGYSRDDAEGKFLNRYLEGVEVNDEKIKILTDNPFEVLDRKGVGKLMKLAIEYGLQANPSLKLGICGEHGGEPSSIEFVEQLGLHYVSCSPFRLPLARLAAAQARIKGELVGANQIVDK